MLQIEHLPIFRNGLPVMEISRLAVPAPGVLFLLGSGGAGKTSTLTTLARSISGDVGEVQATLCGRPLKSSTLRYLPQRRRSTGAPGRIAPPDARTIADLCRCGGSALESQLSEASDHSSLGRLLEVMTTLADPAEILLLDEPTFELEEPHASVVRRRLCELASERLIVVATHNRQDCLAVGGWCALLAGGTVKELAPVEQFFAAPTTEAGKRYVQTGACNLSGPVRDSGNSAGSVWWAVRGLLGGMARPGMFGPLADQAQELRDAGIRHLVCLEERRQYEISEFRQHDIACHHLPVPDMAPPQFGQAVDLCRRLEPEIRENRGVVMHCRGGLGRTGTLMACVLVWFGDDSQAAIAKVRAARPMAIQSDAQTRFIHDFADRVRGWLTPAVAI